MIRTIINLDSDEKKWLDEMAKLKHVSMAQLVRIAIMEYRQEHDHDHDLPTKVDILLQQTKGIWPDKDGLAYQIKIRDEWKD